MKEVNPGTVTGTLSWYKISPLSGYTLIRVRTRIRRRWRRVYESQGDRKEFQPEETKDDAETQKDFWSIQGDFI